MQPVFPLAPTPDDTEREIGRMLFAQGAEFLKGVVAMDGLPDPDRMEVCFAGRSNVGKSTLIKAVAGLLPVTNGTIRQGTDDITNIRPDQMAVHGIAYVPQSDNIFRNLSIGQNLDLALRRLPENAFARRAELLDQFPVLADKLAENIQAFVDLVMSLKPNTIKGIYVKSAHISGTMSPSVRLAV